MGAVAPQFPVNMSVVGQRMMFLMLGWLPWFFLADVLHGAPWTQGIALLGTMVLLLTPPRFGLFSALLQCLLAVGLGFGLFTFKTLADSWVIVLIVSLCDALQVLMVIADARSRKELALDLAAQLPPPTEVPEPTEDSEG